MSYSNDMNGKLHEDSTISIFMYFNRKISNTHVHKQYYIHEVIE